jgi:hypothetical protein
MESNKTVVKKELKKFLANNKEVCAFCGWHKGENASKKQKSWKKHVKGKKFGSNESIRKVKEIESEQE